MDNTGRAAGGVRRSTVAALAVVVGVLVAAVALFVALFVVERGAIGALDAELAGTERDLAATEARLADNESDVDGLDRERGELEAANTELRKCADPATASVVAATTGDDAGLDAAVTTMLTTCVR